MLGDLERLAQDRQSEIERAVTEARKASSDAQALQILLRAMEEIREELASQATKTVTIDNFDEVQAALRNELTKISKPIIEAMKSLNLTKDKLETVRTGLEKKNMLVFDKSDDIEIVRRPRTKLTIENLSDILFPEELKVSNFMELKSYFDTLCETMKTCMKVSVEAPQVTVNPPEIKLPEIVVPEIVMPESTLDLSPLLEAIKSLKDVIRRTSANTLSKMQAFSGPNSVEVRKGQIRVNNTPTESIPTVTGLSLPKFDYVANVIAGDTETYTFKTGGASGTTVATVVVVYTDSGRTDIETVTKT